MAGEIEEIPLDIPEKSEKTENITENMQKVPEIIKEVAEKVEEIPEKAKPKPKGRPKGSPNKPKAKKAPEPTLQDYAPSSPRRQLRIPTEPTASDVAAEMLRLLQEQSASKQMRKRAQYESWFR